MNKDLLIQGNIDVDEGVHRCGDNADLYEQVLHLFLDDGNFAKAKEYFEAGDYQNLFAPTHEMKGMSGNLSIKPLFEAASNVVALLRAEDRDAIPGAFAQMETAYLNAIDVIKTACE